MFDRSGRDVTYEQRLRELVEEAVEADQRISHGGDVYAANDVHAWLDRLASGAEGRWPEPQRQ
jgi:hypothetical protein